MRADRQWRIPRRSTRRSASSTSPGPSWRPAASPSHLLRHPPMRPKPPPPPPPPPPLPRSRLRQWPRSRPPMRRRRRQRPRRRLPPPRSRLRLWREPARSQPRPPRRRTPRIFPTSASDAEPFQRRLVLGTLLASECFRQADSPARPWAATAS